MNCMRARKKEIESWRNSFTAYSGSCLMKQLIIDTEAGLGIMFKNIFNKTYPKVFFLLLLPSKRRPENE